MTVIWTPQAKQEEFMSRSEWEVFYGGAAGGGKSDALVIEALRQIRIPHYRGILFRKTYPEARELIDKSLNIYPQISKGAKYNSSAHEWKFPSGARIEFGSMQYEQDRLKYQGRAFQFVGWDELTHFTWPEYSYMFSRCRPNGPGVDCYIRATGNPGGIGHGWVKERFVTAGKPGETLWSEVRWTDLNGKVQSSRRSRVFIPSTVFDNPALLQNDPDYIASLASLPEAERNALLYGDWDTFSGQVFTEWRNEEEHYDDRQHTHVINPFRIPDDWSIWCGMDWGFAKPFSIVWIAVTPERRMYLINSYYGCTGEPNVGVQKDPAEVARDILAMEESDVNLRGKRIHRVGDPAIWGSQISSSVGDMMSRETHGLVNFERGNNSRIDGKMQFHYRLAMDDFGNPMFYVFNTRSNRDFIRTIPSLVYDETHVEDIDTDGEDHIYDATRYVFMANPIARPKAKAKPKREYDPLDIEDDYYTRNNHNKYRWYIQ